MDEREQLWDESPTSRPAASGVLFFLLCAVLLVGGLALFAVAFDLGNGLLFVGAILVWSLAFVLPLVTEH